MMDKILDVLNKVVSFAGGYVDGISPARAVICSVLFLVVYAAYLSFMRTQTGSRMITWIDGKIREESSRFSWEDVTRKQKAMGVDYYVPKMMLPHYYFLVHIFVVIVAGLLIFVLAGPKLTPLSLLAVFIPTAWYKHKDKVDNDEIITDIMSIASALSVQITGGEYLGSAVCECKDVVHNKRLKAALKDFDKSIKMGSLTLLEAINELSSKFTSSEVQTLCIILRQGIETGRTIDCAADLSKQCFSARELSFESKKAQLDRLITFAMLIVFADGIGFIFYQFLTKLGDAF